MMKAISVRGARTHNLKNVSLDIPRDKLTVITGLSGSGKSSLAFDTLYAEGQRRYVESISAYARQFLELRPRPDVDGIDGLSPSIAIGQRRSSGSSRSVVGTVTEISDYMRLLFARAGVPYCPEHGKHLEMSSIASIVDRTLTLSDGAKIMVLAPVSRGKTSNFKAYFEKSLADGYVRFRIDGVVQVLEVAPSLNDGRPHDVDVVVDRLKVSPEARTRLAESCQSASDLSNGRVYIEEFGTGMHYEFSTQFACPLCSFSVPALEPIHFSPFNPAGCCTACEGTGTVRAFDAGKVVTAETGSIEAGAIPGWDARNGVKFKLISAAAEVLGVSVRTPWCEYPEEVKQVFLYGNEQTRKLRVPFIGVMNDLQRQWDDPRTLSYMRQGLETYRSDVTCPVCKGERLRPELLSVYVGDGDKRYSYGEMNSMSLSQLRAAFAGLEFSERRAAVAERLTAAISSRLAFLENVGLGYLSLNRRADTLSGGEMQRIRLASQIGSGLSGVLYVLDEPSIGLHQRDNDKLIATLCHLRDLGNTVIVVEHDEDTMYASDYIVDIGPGAGVHGGEVVCAGTLEEIMACDRSVTGQYLSGKKFIPVPATRREGNGKWLTVKGAQQNNLKKVNASIPLGTFTAVTGVSGSGKSSLINEILYKGLAAKLNQAKARPGKHKEIVGIEELDKVIEISQSPIGRTPRSNPATYTGVFTDIRQLFAQTAEAKARGYDSGRFSFNVKGGRCEACEGDGILQIEMHFLPDIYVPCEVCKGKRYNRETLEVKYKDKNISDVLEMTAEEAAVFFENIPKIARKIQTLCDVGLGYVKLGQPATTLSGGEAQRVKLATELSKRATGRTIYILDEPTTGLHAADVHKLIEVLQTLVDSGNTVVVIEHNLDVIKTADYIIDLGPEGGDRGGQIVATGTPEQVAQCEGSYTGKYLKKVLEKAQKQHPFPPQ